MQIKYISLLLYNKKSNLIWLEFWVIHEMVSLFLNVYYSSWYIINVINNVMIFLNEYNLYISQLSKRLVCYFYININLMLILNILHATYFMN